VIQSAIQAYHPPVPNDAGRAGIGLVVTLVLMAVSFWGALTITAITSDPNVDRAEATRLATARLPAQLGVFVLLTLAGTLLVVPLLGVMAASGVDLASLGQPGAEPRMTGGSALAVGLYSLLLLGAFLWLLARLLPLVPVVLHERLGLRAIGRAFRLTRGMGWRLVGALLLFLIVLSVASGAATYVTGAILAVILGQGNAATAQFLGGVFGAVIGTVLSVLAYAFSARLYVMLTGRDLHRVFEDAPRPA
jgi:hypothetical protein